MSYDSKKDAEQAADRARIARKNERAHVTTGFVAGSLAMGALGSGGRNMIPAQIMGIDSDFVIGGVAFLYSRRGTSKRHAQARGLAYSSLAGGLRDLGASLATRF